MQGLPTQVFHDLKNGLQTTERNFKVSTFAANSHFVLWSVISNRNFKILSQKKQKQVDHCLNLSHV